MIELKRAEDEDKNFLFDLRKLTMTQHLDGMWIHLSDEDHWLRVESYFDETYIIFKDQKKIWMIKYLQKIDCLEIMQFQIMPEFQWRWLWTKVLQHMIELSKTVNKKLSLWVLKSNPAINLYKRHWFVVTWEDQIEYFMEREVWI